MDDLHIFFLPLLAPGHMIPIVDLAKLFAARGVRATILTTAANTPLIEPSIACSPRRIQLLTLPFPPSVPHNVTNLPTPDFTWEFLEAIDALKVPFDQLINEHRPDCIVSDIFYPWSADLALGHGIPRLAFTGMGAFAISVVRILHSLKPQETVISSEDNKPNIILPGIPHRIEMVKSQLPSSSIFQPDHVMVRIVEAQRRTYGTIVNTFAELEPGYGDRLQGKSWLVGPVVLCNRDARESAARGGKQVHNFDTCMNWLDIKKPGTVLYVCFGSLGKFARAQFHEIAAGLADSNHPFIWVVKNVGEGGELMPEGFEERVAAEGKGLIVRGWAPQVTILNHSAVGGFMTHCGWNSCLEGATAGVPMVTWPLFAEQFFNERLVVDVLRIGVSVGAKVCSGSEEKRTLVKGEVATKAANEVMGGGEEAEDRRKRAKKLAEMARTAMEEGGSSYMNMSRLIQDLMDVKKVRAAGLDDKNQGSI